MAKRQIRVLDAGRCGSPVGSVIKVDAHRADRWIASGYAEPPGAVTARLAEDQRQIEAAREAVLAELAGERDEILATAKTEAERILSDARERATKEAKEITDAAQADAAKILADAKAPEEKPTTTAPKKTSAKKK